MHLPEVFLSFFQIVWKYIIIQIQFSTIVCNVCVIKMYIIANIYIDII